MRAALLAERLALAYEGDDFEISGAAPLQGASPHELSFVSGTDAFEDARTSRAGCLLVPPDFARGLHNIIRAPSPRAAFAQSLVLLYPPAALQPGIHPSAVVDAEAHVDVGVEVGPLVTIAAGSRIEAGTRIGSGCRIATAVEVGRDCVLHPGVILYERTRVGDRVILHSGCVLGADGFGYVPQAGRWVKFPQVGSVSIEDDVEIGANSCIDRGALGVTRIGRGTKLDNLVHVAHNCNIGADVVVAAQTGFSGGVIVGDGCIVGGQVGVGDKARIEPGSVIGSGSGILTKKVVRAGEPQWGTPARPLRDHLRQLAMLARLPGFVRRLRALEARFTESKNTLP